MLRIIILLLLTSNIYANEHNLTDAQLAKQVQTFADDVNKSARINTVIDEQAQQSTNDRGHKLIVFISTSMPHKSIQQWARQAELFGAELVIRGFVNNSFKETIALAQELFSKDNVGGFNIDPFKFKKYAIDSVPTVVLDVSGTVDYVRGDIGLFDALKIIRDKGENRKNAQNYLSQI